MNFEPCKNHRNGIPETVFHEFLIFLDALSLIAIHAEIEPDSSSFQLPSNLDRDFVENSYECLIPFLVESAIGQHDVYCYDYEQKSSPKVLVVTEDAVVKKWASISEFLLWMNAQTSAMAARRASRA